MHTKLRRLPRRSRRRCRPAPGGDGPTTIGGPDELGAACCHERPRNIPLAVGRDRHAAWPDSHPGVRHRSGHLHVDCCRRIGSARDIRRSRRCSSRCCSGSSYSRSDTGPVRSSLLRSAFRRSTRSSLALVIGGTGPLVVVLRVRPYPAFRRGHGRRNRRRQPDADLHDGDRVGRAPSCSDCRLRC